MQRSGLKASPPPIMIPNYGDKPPRAAVPGVKVPNVPGPGGVRDTAAGRAPVDRPRQESIDTGRLPNVGGVVNRNPAVYRAGKPGA